MNKSIRYYLLKWWLWPLVLIVLQIIQFFIIRNCNNVGTDVPASVIRVVNFRDPIAIISIILIIANLCLWIYYIIKKQGKAISGHLALMVIAVAICLWNILSIGVWWMFGGDRLDDFGRKHPIPENVEYNEPLPSHYSDRIDEFGNSQKTVLSDFINPSDSATWLQIKNGGQGGRYYYNFYIPEGIDNGEIWLECYEVTENIQLSSKRIRERTLLTVTEEMKGKISEREFTIYEGVWGEFYLARIEVWFQDSSTHTKQKLSEKVYKVEGWMR